MSMTSASDHFSSFQFVGDGPSGHMMIPVTPKSQYASCTGKKMKFITHRIIQELGITE